MNGAEVLIDALERHGVRYVFGIPGHGNTNILDAIHGSDQIDFKLVRHEQAAAHIADGYARVSGEVGVCCSSVGPGAANMIMGIATAMSTSSPVLAIVGAPIQRWYGRGQLQETSRPDTAPTDQAFMQMLQPITKRVWSIADPRTIPTAVRKAFTAAQVGRPGPVGLEIPWDLQAAEVDTLPEDPDPFPARARPRADAELTNSAAQALVEAEFPVIIAGNGALISGAGAAVAELAESLGAAIASSFVSKGVVPEDHPLAVGMVGWLGHPVAHELIRERADVILAVGYRFADESTSWWTEGKPFVPQNRIIQIDIEAREMGRAGPIELGLEGDALAVLNDLREAIERLGGRASAAADAALIRRAMRAYSHELTPPDATPMQPLRLADQVRRMLPDDSIISVDTGNHAHYFAAFYPVRSGGRFLNPGGWTPMGWGPTAIIGAKLAQPDKACVAITGDGGFLMVNQEVSTAVEWGLPVVWLVFNNSSLAAIRDGQLADFGGRIIGTEYTVEVDYAVLGRALGAEGVRVTRHDEVEDAIRWALDCGRPCVVDLVVATDAVRPPIAGAWYEPGRAEPPPMPRGSEVRYSAPQPEQSA